MVRTNDQTRGQWRDSCSQKGVPVHLNEGKSWFGNACGIGTSIAMDHVWDAEDGNHGSMSLVLLCALDIELLWDRQIYFSSLDEIFEVERATIWDPPSELLSSFIDLAFELFFLFRVRNH